MKTVFLIGATAISFLACGLSPAPAQDLTPPVVAKAIPKIDVRAGAPARVINLQDTFALQGVASDTIVRFTTSLGNIDVELYHGATPVTVANFLGYVNRGAASNGGYNGTLIQRSIPGFVLQGGSYYINSSGDLAALAAQAAISSEAQFPNDTGTIAMALSTGPDSATNAWFFNLADNTSGTSNLDTGIDGGPFTVFGRVIEDGMETIDSIVALKTYNFEDSLGESFENVPLISFSGSNLSAQDLVYTNTIAEIPLMASSPGETSLMTIKVLDNTNPLLVKATLTGQKLKLKFRGKRTGIAKITLQATDAANSTVTTTFKITVR